MPDTVPTDQPDPMHPSWCHPPNCTALRGLTGTHRSANHMITFTGSAGTVNAWLELGHPPMRPLLVIEQRNCGCLDCEPVAVIPLSAGPAHALLAALTELIEDLGPVTP